MKWFDTGGRAAAGWRQEGVSVCTSLHKWRQFLKYKMHILVYILFLSHCPVCPAFLKVYPKNPLVNNNLKNAGQTGQTGQFIIFKIFFYFLTHMKTKKF
jgi:hypothetical protein